MSYIGTMLSLADFVKENREPLIADFQREYGLDLDEEILKGISAERMKALVNGIGINSALHRHLNEDWWRWGIQEELLATVCELLDAGNRAFIMANSEHPGKMEPIKIPRPGGQTREEQKSGTTMAELLAMQPTIKKGEQVDD